MYGVPADLDLSDFLGATLVQICLGTTQIQFNFADRYPLPIGQRAPLSPSIHCEGEWILLDGKGTVLDQTKPLADRGEYRLHRLLGGRVVQVRVASPTSFELIFESGVTLRFLEDGRPYESFSLFPSGVII